MMVWGARRGLGDKAKLYYHICGYHQQDFPTLGSYSKFVEATNRCSRELRGLLALLLHHNRQAQHGYPIVLPDSMAVLDYPIGEPAIDLGQQLPGLFLFPLLLPQPAQAHHCTQL
jgi:hypothetical protein